MKFARSLLIFTYGLFTIAAQSLLFREFITSFEGNDISVGIFFASWFLWVGLGAIIVNKIPLLAEKLLKNIELLFLSYLPAFILELILLIHARDLAGIESYTLLPVSAILLLSIIVNAPVSIITGMLFPTICRWIQTESKQPVSWVYLIEAAGSFIGGLGVTILLGFGVSLTRIFFILAFLLSVSVLLVQLTKVEKKSKAKIASALIGFCILLCFSFGADRALMRHLRITKWSKLLPAQSLAGSFQTAQAEYLYGIYQDQWVVMCQGSICEALPAEVDSGKTAAISLCQKPDAKNVLVVGSGLGTCRQFLHLPQIQKITWSHSDSEYVQKINNFINLENKINDPRFSPFADDVRQLFTKKQQLFDIIIVNLPDATNSVLNRYYTLEFYRQAKESLSPDGILSVRIAGGENIMGTELINLGASTILTLEKIFTQLVLVPGEDTWFIASDSDILTSQPGILRDRFAKIKGAESIFPPQGLLSIYLPDRETIAMENYSAADLPSNFLINLDSRPLTHLYSLLLTAKQSGAPAARLIKNLIVAGPGVFLIPILIIMLFRGIYLLKFTEQGKPSAFDSNFMIFSTGSVAMGMIIVLMYLYQTRFGSLYLHIGIISSLFMLGLTAGAALTRFLLKSSKSRSKFLLFVIFLIHSLVLCTIALWPGQQWSHPVFVSFFILCGLCAGCYFPIAAEQLAFYAFETKQAASKLETADHLGASAGGLLTSLILIPVLGTKITILMFILFVLMNLPPALLKIFKPQKICFPVVTFRFRTVGYVLLAIGISIVLCSNLLNAAASKLLPSLSGYAAQALAGELRIEQLSVTIDNNAGRINYYNVYDSNEQLAGYVFSSEDLAPQVRGFGGKINLAIYVDKDGKLIDFNIIRSNESPSYLEMLTQWRKLLNGRVLFSPGPFEDVDVVTGATVSSQAIMAALQTSGHKFTTNILGRTIQTKEKTQAYNFLDKTGIYLIITFIFTLIVVYYGGFWTRLIVLCFNLVGGGIILNAQYSSEQIATVLSFHAPAAGLSGAFILVAGILLSVIFFGNIYCGYLCPFGAAQELVSFIVPGRSKPFLQREEMRKARSVKYIILFILMVVFFVSRNRTTLAADPLISTFNIRSLSSFKDSFMGYGFQSLTLLLILAALAGSVFYTRFWCRYLCPVGAFLSLFNNVIVLKRYLPAKKFDKCKFGLTIRDNMDCIYCDKCRYEKFESEKTQKDKTSNMFLVYVIVTAVIVSAFSVKRFMEVIPADFGQSVVSAASGGQPRDIDLQRIRKMIRQKKLSDKEAQFYKKVGQKEPQTEKTRQ